MKNWTFVLLSTAFISMSGLAQAGTPMTVEVDQSQLITLNTDPGSIVVGNPSIADVTLNGRQVFVHGRAFGETNLMIFDAAGEKLVDFSLVVSHNSPAQVSYYYSDPKTGALRRTYSCAPNCEVNMMAGDESDFFGTATGQNQRKFDFATGYRPADTKATTGTPQ